VAHSFADGRHGWLQIALGSARLDGKRLTAGDGVAFSGEPRVVLEGEDDSKAEVLLFDLA
jgi:redox-sensitive bicupin YhaK (pirin superfamily)